jgi:hypothetical protein
VCVGGDGGERGRRGGALTRWEWTRRRSDMCGRHGWLKRQAMRRQGDAMDVDESAGEAARDGCGQDEKCVRTTREAMSAEETARGVSC